MVSVSPRRAAKSRIATVVSASDELPTVGCDSEGDDWFARLAQTLLAKPGLELHLITGFPERTCYRYASGELKPPGYFLRAILRSEQGAPFFAALMDGSAAVWWRDLSAARDLNSKFKIESR